LEEILLRIWNRLINWKIVETIGFIGWQMNYSMAKSSVSKMSVAIAKESELILSNTII
jgi:hypothetical protein